MGRNSARFWAASFGLRHWSTAFLLLVLAPSSHSQTDTVACTTDECKSAAALGTAFKPTVDSLAGLNFCSMSSASHFTTTEPMCKAGESWNTPPPAAKQLAARGKAMDDLCSRTADDTTKFRETSDKVAEGLNKTMNGKAPLKDDVVQAATKAQAELLDKTAAALESAQGVGAAEVALLGAEDPCKYVDPSCYDGICFNTAEAPIDLSSVGTGSYASSSTYGLSLVPRDSAPSGPAAPSPEEQCGNENTYDGPSGDSQQFCYDKFQPRFEVGSSAYGSCFDACSSPLVPGYDGPAQKAAQAASCQTCKDNFAAKKAAQDAARPKQIAECAAARDKVMTKKITDFNAKIAACVHKKKAALAKADADAARAQKATDDAKAKDEAKKAAADAATKSAAKKDATAKLAKVKDDLERQADKNLLARPGESLEDCHKRNDAYRGDKIMWPDSDTKKARMRAMIAAYYSNHSTGGGADCSKTAGMTDAVCKVLNNYTDGVKKTWAPIYTDDRVKRLNALTDTIKDRYKTVINDLPVSADEKKKLLTRLNGIHVSLPDNFLSADLTQNAYCACHREFHGADSATKTKAGECSSHALVVGPQYMMMLDRGKAGEDAVATVLAHEMGHGLTLVDPATDSGDEKSPLDKNFNGLAACMGTKQNFNQFDKANKNTLGMESVADWLSGKVVAQTIKNTPPDDRPMRMQSAIQKFCWYKDNPCNKVNGEQVYPSSTAVPSGCAAVKAGEDHPAYGDRMMAMLSDPDVRASMGCAASGVSAATAGSCGIGGLGKP